MDGIEKFIKVFRDEIDRSKGYRQFFIGSVGDDGVINVGDFSLDKDDYLLSADLVLASDYVENDNDTCFLIPSHIVSAGDSVFVVRVNDDDFVVVCKVK